MPDPASFSKNSRVSKFVPLHPQLIAVLRELLVQESA
jgi:hypothetical protein